MPRYSQFNRLCAHLHQDLSHRKLKKYNVRDVYRVDDYNHAEFYGRYKSVAEFYACCMSYEIRRHLNTHREADLRERFMHLLVCMEQDWIYFYNIYSLSKNKACICNLFKSNLRAFLMEYLSKRNIDCSNEMIESFSGSIYRILFDWVQHECRESSKVIMNEFGVLLHLMEYGEAKF